MAESMRPGQSWHKLLIEELMKAIHVSGPACPPGLQMPGLSGGGDTSRSPKTALSTDFASVV